MDFLDPKKKRSHTIRLFIGYVLVGIALLLASTLLLFASFGYGIKRSTGEVTQNGIAFIDAHPEQAKITINGQDRGQTDGRFVLESGTYTVELTRDGYRPWKRDFTLAGGDIVRLVYPFLFPINLQSNAIFSMTTKPDLVTQSPDRRWIMVHNPSAFGAFTVIDTSSKDDKQRSITVPAAVFGQHSGKQSLELVEWSTDNRHMLVKHQYADGSSYIVLDREQPDLSTNISAKLGGNFVTITLRDKQSDELYTLDKLGGELKQVSLKTGQTQTIATNVQAFWPYKQNTVLYTVSGTSAQDKVLVRLRDGNVTYDIRELTASSRYMLNIAEFNNRMYVVAGGQKDGKVYIYEDPIKRLSEKPTEPLYAHIMFKVDNATYAQFSANARFISVQGGSHFAVFDAETEQQYHYSVTDTPDLTFPETRWMDGHRLMSVTGGKMTVFDYDNTNKQTLVATEATYIPMFDRDYNALYTVSQFQQAQPYGISKTDLHLGKE